MFHIGKHFYGGPTLKTQVLSVLGLIGSPLLQEVVGGGISLHVKVNVPQILPHGRGEEGRNTS